MSDTVHQLLTSIRAAYAERGVPLREPHFESDVHDACALPDSEVAAKRIVSALVNGEKVAVYADFDCDGIPGAVILHDLFEKLGHGAHETYIPHRHDEGYGVHQGAIDTLAKRGVQLIITVDVGTLAHDAVRYAGEKGIDVIITDHHEPGETLPDAVAVVNPKREGYPFPHLCGAAVAWKLASAVIAEARTHSFPGAAGIPHGWERWLLDMVGIATVADMVPLVGENRALTHFGLLVLRKSPRPGIRALCKKARVDQRSIIEDDIGFSFAPRINAASRMDEPEVAFRLLTAKDQEEADELAARLEKLNAARKGVVAHLVKDAREKVRMRCEGKTVAVAGDPSWKPALLGLAANSVLSGRAGAVCLWGRDGKGVLKGSCRSDGSIDIVRMFSGASGCLLEAGGHAQAGGFSVSHETVHTLQEELERAAAGSARSPEGATEDAWDAPASAVSFPLYEALRSLGPFGVGVEKPVLRVRVTVRGVRLFGKEKEHTEMIVVGEDGAVVRAFEFFKKPKDFSVAPEVGSSCTVVGVVERDQFKGARACALRIQDVVA